MSYTVTNSRGPSGVAWMDINTNDADSADAGIEVDDLHTGPAVEKLRLDLRQFTTLHLDIWAEDENLDVALEVLRGYNAAGDEVWEAAAVETVLTAATSDSEAGVLSAMAELFSGAIRPGIYRVAAQRAQATDPGRLHIFGHAKA